MQPGYNIVIADTTCIILLDKIGQLELLRKIFTSVSVTKETADEYGKPFPEWIVVKSVSDKHYQKILETEIDRGEASAMALSIELGNALLILDDLKARQFAGKLQLNYTGTLGLLLSAKQKAIIPSVRFYIEKIKHPNFRFSSKLLDEIIKEAGE